MDGSPVTATSKAAFLQSWLFFGTLHTVSQMCGLTIDVQAEFLIEDGRSVSTAALNGLARRWFASLATEKIGDKAFMERILAIARQIELLLGEEMTSGPERKPLFRYTADEARVLFALEILLRVLLLHLLLHVESPGFTCSEDEGWKNGRISGLADRVEGYREGNKHLYGSKGHMATRGWCTSEAFAVETGQATRRFAAVIDRPVTRDHSVCGKAVCQAYQVNEITYKSAHTDECSSAAYPCDLVGVPTKELLARLDQDEIPGFVITDDLNVEVVSADRHSYAAISHVCSCFHFDFSIHGTTC